MTKSDVKAPEGMHTVTPHLIVGATYRRFCKCTSSGSSS